MQLTNVNPLKLPTILRSFSHICDFLFSTPPLPHIPPSKQMRRWLGDREMSSSPEGLSLHKATQVQPPKKPLYLEIYSRWYFLYLQPIFSFLVRAGGIAFGPSPCNTYSEWKEQGRSHPESSGRDTFPSMKILTFRSSFHKKNRHTNTSLTVSFIQLKYLLKEWNTASNVNFALTFQVVKGKKRS